MRIALIKPSALGDIVHALPVLGALRHRFPDAHITWVVNRSYEPLLKGHPALDATLPFDRAALRRGGPVRGLGYALRFARRLRAGRFDLVLDLQGLFRSGLMAAVTGARRRVGFSDAREGATYFYTEVVPAPGLDAIHAVDHNWLMAEALGAGDAPKRFDVPLDPAAVRLHGPYGGFAGAVATGVECRGSYLRKCDHLSCMKELTPDRLRGPLTEVLSAWPSANRRSA